MTISTSMPPYTVVVTRPELQAGNLVRLLENAGIGCVLFPTTQIEPLPFSNELQVAIAELAHGGFTWIVFTSANGVKYFASAQSSIMGSAAVPAKTLIACQGERSSETAKSIYGRCDFTPRRSVLEDLAQELSEHFTPGQKCLLAGAEDGRDVIEKALALEGIHVNKVKVYRTVTAKLNRDAVNSLLFKSPSELIFTFFSPSSFNSTLELLGESSAILKQCKIVSVGPVTTRAIEAHNFKVSAESDKQSDEGVLETLLKLLD